MNILIAEDKQEIAELVKLFLIKEGYNVFIASDGKIALEQVQKEIYDLCIFDIMMPYINGLELTKEVRKFSSVPIIILTAKNLESDKILGLDLGADDYITKPFSSLELVSRVNALLRRTYSLSNQIEFKFGPLTINKEKCIVTKNGDNCNLTATEYKILLKLLSSPEHVFTKSQLYDAVGENYYQGDDNTIIVHISKLRDKIEDDPKEPKLIKTIRGLGYKIEKH